jgi:retinol-binding protein 3
MRTIKKILIFTLILSPGLAFSQGELTNKEKVSVVTKIQELIDSNYIFVDQIEFVNNSLDSLYSTGKYEQITDYGKFAWTLTEDLRGITKDLHFRVNYNPDFIKMILSEPESDEEEDLNWEREQGLKENFGFSKIEILKGNIGYLKFNFFYPLDMVKPTIDAAMGFVCNTDALIIDLMDNQGGYGPTDNYIGSYFFDKEQIHWASSYDRPLNERTSDSTFNEISGKRMIDIPVTLLISKNTVSNAEKFAYCLQKLGRVKIIGQTSAGAANGSDFLVINENYGIQIPVVTITIPTTNSNWEGTGVQPDIEIKKEDALGVAYIETVDILIENSDDSEQIKKYNDIKTKINNR